MLALRYAIPNYFASHFPMTIMSQISALAGRRQSDQVFDCTGKSTKEIVRAANMGFVSGPDAFSALMDKFRALDSQDAGFELSKIEIELSLKQLEVQAKSGSGLSPDSHGIGVLYFVYCKCTSMVASAISGTSTSLPSDSLSLPKSSSSISATLHRPESLTHFGRALNHWVLILDALSVSKAIVSASFLDRTVWQNVSERNMDWPVAHELFLLYIRRVDAEGDVYSLPSVVQSLGGLDAFREEAFHSAHKHWPSTCFRAGGGVPRETGRTKDITNNYANFVTCSACNDGASTICKWYNLQACGGKHDPTDVDRNGRCKHRHVCNQFVTDKGKGGRCEGHHPRFECDYDASKRCKNPVK